MTAQTSRPAKRLFLKQEIEQSIPQRFRQQVQQYGPRIAVKTPQESLTYIEFDELSNQIANLIAALGIAPGSSIALVMEQSALLIAAIMGVLKSGNIYVPLDPALPVARLELLLADTQALLVLSDSTNAELATRIADRGLIVRNVTKEHPTQDARFSGSEISPGAYAYIYYTSGTTGDPKGVVDDHRNVLHNIMRYTNSLAICSDDRLVLLQSCGFSGAVSNIFSALLNGATLYPFDLRAEGVQALAHWLAAEEISIFHTVATTGRWT